MKTALGWVLGIFGLVALFVVISAATYKPSAASQEADKQECVKAMMSDMGTSTRNYQDKQAYDAHVAEKCKGFSINGKPLG